MSSAICWKCFEDEYLQRIIKEEYKPGECVVCGNDNNNAITVEDLGKLIEPILRERFRPGRHRLKFDEDNRSWYEQEGEPLSYAVQIVLNQNFDFVDKIVDAVTEAEGCRPRDSMEAYFNADINYVETPVRVAHYFKEWDYALRELKHQRRFFSPSAQSLFEKLFTGINEMKAWNDGSKVYESVVYEMPVGYEFFRGRVCDPSLTLKDVYSDPMKYVGPPPADRARAGRMNADGVAVFYAAKHRETCIAELRPALGSDSVVITVRTSKPLRLLDFTRLEESHGSGLSYFQPDFTVEVEKRAFLRQLHTLISQPIIPGKESDYLITQTMAEYLAHVHCPGFDGILFSSVQHAGGINVVLFPGQDNSFPLNYVYESIQLLTTRSIEYEHQERNVALREGEVLVDCDHKGYSDDDLDD